MENKDLKNNGLNKIKENGVIILKEIALLIKFMTRLPMPKVKFDSKLLGKSMMFFPVVGIIIGLINWIVGTGVYKLEYERITHGYLGGTLGLVTAFVLVALEVILTGGLHLDGLADTFDGIFSYRSKQKMLEIMKDSRVGTNGVLILIFYILGKVIFLMETAKYLGVSQGILMLMVPVIARIGGVINCATEPYARATGMGKTFVENTDKKGMIVSLVIATLFVIVVSILNKISLLTTIGTIVIVALSSYLFGKLMTRKIGGITGDTLGALLELSSLLALVLMYLF